MLNPGQAQRGFEHLAVEDRLVVSAHPQRFAMLCDGLAQVSQK